VTSIKMLAVTITNHLSAGEHVRNVIGKCAQSLHALKLLRCQGMSDDSLTHIYKAVVLAKLLYASPHGGVLPARPTNNVLKHLYDVPSGLAWYTADDPLCHNWLLTWTTVSSQTY